MQPTLYEQIADELSSLIDQGHYTINERMPSLRSLSTTYNVSVTTAIQAYQLLEQQGLVEARPRSGYFVRARRQAPEVPSHSRPPMIATKVTVAHLAMSLIQEARSATLVRLGAAVPGDDMLPLGQLARAVSGSARRHYKSPGAYADTQGEPALRKEIVKLMREAGCRTHAREIVVTNGCLEALSIALRVVARPGDTIAIESPTYFGILQTIENMGMKALEIATHPQHGICLESLGRALDRRRIGACILVPSFSNPTGALVPEPSRQRLVALLERAGVPLIEDDIYGGLGFSPRRPKALKAWDNKGTVVYCSSFSKTLAPGLRLGWIAAGTLTEKIIYQKFLENISTAIYPQLAVCELLKRGSYRRTLRRTAAVYRRRMEQLRHWVLEYFPAGTRMSNPQGGFLLWVELPQEIQGIELYRRALDKGIAITPGILFSAQQQFQNYIRLSCAAVDGEQARKALKRLGALASGLGV